MAQGGLANLSSIFGVDQIPQPVPPRLGANYIRDYHARGFTLGGQINGTDFLGIEGSTYNNPGMFGDTEDNFANYIKNLHMTGFTKNRAPGTGILSISEFMGISGDGYSNPGLLWEGIDPSLQSVHASELILSPGFVPGLQEGDDTLFSGILGTEFTNLGDLGFGGSLPQNPQNWILDIHATGFTELGPIEEGRKYTTKFEGITIEERGGLKFINKGIMGFGGVNDNGDANYIADTVMAGFTKNRAPGYANPPVANRGGSFASSEYQGISSFRYENPGKSLGIHYELNYDPILGASIQGVDYINAGPTGNSQGKEHATGFTKRITDILDPDETKISEFHMVQNLHNETSDGDGTIFDELFPGSGEDYPFGNTTDGTGIYGETIDGGEFVPGNDFTLQNSGERSVTIGNTPLTGLTLADIYKSRINDIIDWEKVQSKTNVGAKYNSNIGWGGFLPLTADRGSLLPNGEEPYIVRPIPASSENGEGRLNILSAHLEDAVRLAKYALSADGVKFMGIQNASGLGAYMAHLGIIHGSDIDAARKYDKFLTDLAGGHQQFQYLYNPLSMFSSNIPFIKVRLNRAYKINEGTYLDRKDNALNLNAFLSDEMPKNAAAPFPDVRIDNIKKGQTTLGGSITHNVNVSIDGTPVAEEAIKGDAYTLAPIADFDTIKNDGDLFPPERPFHQSENGFPFYFKDLRNDKLLVFRGYIEDINENLSANWNEHTYIGRSEPVYTYQNTSRDLNFTLKIYPMNLREVDKIYEKLNYLNGMCYPEYFRDSSLGHTRPKPPLCRLRLADLYGGQPKTAVGETPSDYRFGALGFIQSVNYTFDGPWDSLTRYKNYHRVPKFITANISYKIIHDEVPKLGTAFYGYRSYSEGGTEIMEELDLMTDSI